jgi:predicted O-methyltransferase YrrM
MAANPLSFAADIDNLAKTVLLPPNARLDAAVANSRKHGLPEITVSNLQGQYLAIQAQLIGATNVLEIGTLGGYSAIWFAEAGARVTSIEINPKHRDVALENTKGLDVDVILGAALDVLPKLLKQGRTFDLVFIDADWGEQWDYFDYAVKLLRPKGCIYVDNVVRELLESDAVDGRKESLVTKVGRDERVSATLIPTVATHKNKMEQVFDGFLLAIVK